MESLLISVIMLLFIFLGKLGSCYDGRKYDVSRTITVSKSGNANFTTNTHDHVKLDDGRQTIWAVAALIFGDRASFYQCIFLSLQDTLWDARGRHYFSGCNITGSVDFIWGNGQSIYEGCQIRSLANVIGTTGFITAQGREGPNETTGFVFKDCHVYGSGTSFLGRAYRNYSRVLFSGTYMENVIAPEGWSLWTPPQISFADSIIFAENNCSGPGADMSHRVPWEKKLPNEDSKLKVCCNLLTNNMESLITTILLLLLALFYFLSKLGSCSNAMKFDLTDEVSRTIKVDMKGQGDFRTVQEAIDSIPSNNSWWTRIILNHGLYFEKVVIPQDKPYIILEGHPKFLTAIEFGDFASVGKSPTFTSLADNFVARNILFKNSYDHLIKEDPNRRTTWAVAAKIVGDKASFYHCGFISLQDTLWDARGRHYFYDCDVRGAIDFIWGNGQSIYELKVVKVQMKLLGLYSKIVTYADQALLFLEEHTETTQESCSQGRIWKMLLPRRVGPFGRHPKLVMRLFFFFLLFLFSGDHDGYVCVFPNNSTPPPTLNSPGGGGGAAEKRRRRCRAPRRGGGGGVAAEKRRKEAALLGGGGGAAAKEEEEAPRRGGVGVAAEKRRRRRRHCLEEEEVPRRRRRRRRRCGGGATRRGRERAADELGRER
ncbi:hypothetical protein ACLB2K_003841 [Fragaria x ananassa]